MKWWDKISCIGLDENNDTYHVRHVHIINRVFFLACFFTVVYIPINLILGGYFYSLVQTIIVSFTSIAFWFNSKKMFRFASYYVFFFVIVNITFAIVAHNNNSAEYLMIPGSLAAFVIFKRKSDALITLALFIFGFIIGRVLKFYVDPIILLDEKQSLLFNYINVIISFIVSGAVILNFKSVIESYENTLLTQKKKIEEHNKEMTDSITYAKRIQQAKLPERDEIYTLLPHCFILFKPKDIVSGDFYFFHKKEGIAFIAAADCTGHGVPGALMSMIGSEILNEAFSKTSHLSEVLQYVNAGIKKSLRQSDSDESTRDGMDIVLCAIDTKKNRIKYAGANRPLWIIRKGASSVEEIKATKKAIGGLTENKQLFDCHEIQLQPGDTLYLCTDGYSDQFGGETGKKLMTKNVKEILLGIQNLSMPEQEKHLKTFMENWQGEAEQVDDILVIGVRL